MILILIFRINFRYDVITPHQKMPIPERTRKSMSSYLQGWGKRESEMTLSEASHKN